MGIGFSNQFKYKSDRIHRSKKYIDMIKLIYDNKVMNRHLYDSVQIAQLQTYFILSGIPDKLNKMAYRYDEMTFSIEQDNYMEAIKALKPNKK